MLISCYSRSGGQGKSSLSYALYKELKDDYIFTSNDEDGFLSYKKLIGARAAQLPENANVDKLVSDYKNIIYDAGGYTSKVTLKMLEKSDYIVIPTNLESKRVGSAIKLINEINNNKNIKAKTILAITRYEKTSSFESDKEIVIDKFKDKADLIVFLRKTLIFNVTEEKNCSIQKYLEVNPRYNKSIGQGIYKEFREIVDFIEGVK